MGSRGHSTGFATCGLYRRKLFYILSYSMTRVFILNKQQQQKNKNMQNVSDMGIFIYTELYRKKTKKIGLGVYVIFHQKMIKHGEVTKQIKEALGL